MRCPTHIVFLVCRSHVYCVPNVASFSVWFILDCPFGFSNVYLMKYFVRILLSTIHQRHKRNEERKPVSCMPSIGVDNSNATSVHLMNGAVDNCHRNTGPYPQDLYTKCSCSCQSWSSLNISP
jgi:hypothetical protein